jgi:hypothetical protein
MRLNHVEPDVSEWMVVESAEMGRSQAVLYWYGMQTYLAKMVVC